MKLTQDQENACDVAVDWLSDRTSKYLVIQGSPGTGKSTTIQHLLKRLDTKAEILRTILGSTDGVHEWTVDMLATTNKAAGVLSEMSGRPVSTVHSYFKLRPVQDYTTGEIYYVKGRDHQEIHNRLLIIDESSNLCDDIFKIVNHSTHDCKIILVGDKYQLIDKKQKGIVVADKIQAVRAELTEVVRHDSAIANMGVQCRSMVQTNRFTALEPNNKDILHVSPEECLRMVDTIYADPNYTLDTARILAWTNQSVIRFNEYIRVNVKNAPKHVVVGDKLITNKPILGGQGVMAATETRVAITKIVDTEAVRAGVRGYIVQINGISCDLFLPSDQLEAKAKIAGLKKAGEMMKFFEAQESWLDLRPIFASTVHKSQGSTFDTVFISLTDIGKCFEPNEVARLLHVAVTRASKRVVFFGKLPAKYRGIFHDRYKRHSPA